MSEDYIPEVKSELEDERGYSQLLKSPIFQLLIIFYTIIISVRVLGALWGNSKIDPFSTIPHIIIILSIIGNVVIERYTLREKAPIMTKVLIVVFEIIGVFLVLVYFSWMFGLVN